LKLLVAIAIFAALAFSLAMSRPWRLEVHPDLPLPPGQTNPPLRQLDPSNAIPAGALLWFNTNRTPYGRVLEHDPHHAFPDHTGPGVLVDFNGFEQWIPRPSLHNTWTDSTPPATPLQTRLNPPPRTLL
jgi:hypothetical protein